MIRGVCAVLALAVSLSSPHATFSGPVTPELGFSTFVGSIGDEFASGVATDPDGNVYIVGQTDSTTFPVVNALQSANGGGLDAFVAKLSPDGTRLLWSTYLGGSGNDFGTGIAVDASGAYVTGQTTSKNFPVTPNAFDDDNGRLLSCSGTDCIDSFVSKISADGTLEYSTYLGGEHDDYANGIAVDSEGHALITGITNSFGFPRVNPFDPEKRQGTEAFITKMSADGSAVIYSSYIGGNRGDAGSAVAVDAAGNAIVVGDTLSNDFFTKAPLQAANAGGPGTTTSVDSFVAKIDPGGALMFSTYLGGFGRDVARAVALDGEGSIYVAGETSSDDFPGARSARVGATDVFVAKVRPDGSAVTYATYLGGQLDDIPTGIGVDAAGHATVVGSTRSSDFPTLDALQATCGGCTSPTYFSDAFVTTFDQAGDGLLRSTFLGGSAEDSALGVSVAGNGAVVVAGRTYSSNFPTTANAFQSSCVCGVGNALSAFVLRIGASTSVPTPPSISAIAALKKPFRLQIAGAEFAAGAHVFIGSDATPWPTVQVSSSSLIAVGGAKTLKARFPKGVSVDVRVVNPDGGSATGSFTR